MGKLIFGDLFIPKNGYWRFVRGFNKHPKKGWPGVDYGLLVGSKILGVHNGKVINGRVKDDGVGFGIYQLIQLRNSKGQFMSWAVANAHLNRLRVLVGKEVKRGQWIADSGKSGKSFGAHIHFSLLKRVGRTWVAVDPLSSLVKWEIKNPVIPPYPHKVKPKKKPSPKPKTKTKNKPPTAVSSTKEPMPAAPLRGMSIVGAVHREVSRINEKQEVKQPKLPKTPQVKSKSPQEKNRWVILIQWLLKILLKNRLRH